LGYEWSKRRGHEGMKAIGDGKLVDINDYNNPQKVNSYIRKNFLQQSIDSVDEAIADHVSQAELINMLEFDRFDFNKRIDLISYPEPSLEYTKYEIKRLNENLIDEVLDNKRKPVTKRDRKPGIHPYYGATGEVDKIDKYIFDEKLVLIGEDGAKWQAFENSAFIVDGKYWVNNHAHVIKPNRAKIIDEYLVAVLNVFDLRKYVTGWNNVPKLNQGNLLSIKIPLPPIPVQKKIVKEIQGIEKGGVSYSSIANAQHEIYLKKKVVLDKYLK
jgi:type I restriction enzyme M protein